MWRELDLYEKEIFGKIYSLPRLFGKVIFYGACVVFLIIYLKFFSSGFKITNPLVLVSIPFALGTLSTTYKIYKSASVDLLEIASVKCVEKFSRTSKEHGKSAVYIHYYIKYIDSEGNIETANCSNQSISDLIVENEEMYIVRKKNNKNKNVYAEAYPYIISDALKHTLTTDNLQSWSSLKKWLKDE